MQGRPCQDKRWRFSGVSRVVEFYLDKYVGKTYGGAIENQMEAERDSLEKITLQSLDALRDAARELLTGTDPLLKRLLKLVRDEGKTDKQKAESARNCVNSPNPWESTSAGA